VPKQKDEGKDKRCQDSYHSRLFLLPLLVCRDRFVCRSAAVLRLHTQDLAVAQANKNPGQREGAKKPSALASKVTAPKRRRAERSGAFKECAFAARDPLFLVRI
jgi:hypothetical protein